MPLVPGNKLGPYEIVELLGAGGMGEVYRARDKRLARDAALKVLPEAFACDAQRMVRFEREAKVLASLSHPNIAVLYGLEESKGWHTTDAVPGRRLSVFRKLPDDRKLRRHGGRAAFPDDQGKGCTCQFQRSEHRPALDGRAEAHCPCREKVKNVVLALIVSLQ